MQSVYTMHLTFYCETNCNQLMVLRQSLVEILNRTNTLDEVISHFIQRNNITLGTCSLIKDTDDFVSIETKTTYMPDIAIWLHIIQSIHLTDVKFVYTIENPIKEVFINTDLQGKYYTAKYACIMHAPVLFNNHTSEWVYHSFSSSTELLKYFNDLISNYRTAYNVEMDLQLTVRSAYEALRQFIHSILQSGYIKLYCYNLS